MSVSEKVEAVFAEKMLDQASRLDIRAREFQTYGPWCDAVRKAALLEALQQADDERNRLREALEDIASTDRQFVDANGTDGAFMRIIDKARAALTADDGQGRRG